MKTLFWKCDHKFRRIGEYYDGIYSETRERCIKCGYEREIGENKESEYINTEIT